MTWHIHRSTGYLLSFDVPFGHARHYLGSPESSPILKVVSAAFGLVFGELAADRSLMDALRSGGAHRGADCLCLQLKRLAHLVAGERKG